MSGIIKYQITCI